MRISAAVYQCRRLRCSVSVYEMKTARIPLLLFLFMLLVFFLLSCQPDPKVTGSESVFFSSRKMTTISSTLELCQDELSITLRHEHAGSGETVGDRGETAGRQRRRSRETKRSTPEEIGGDETISFLFFIV